MTPKKQTNSQTPKVEMAKKKRVTKSTRAGILFPVTRFRNRMKDGRYAKIIGTGSSVYIAAVLEYVASEILELAGIVARENNRHRITPRHITMAVKNDYELDTLLKDVTISEGGVVPFIHAELLRKPTQKKSSASSQSQKSSEEL